MTLAKYRKLHEEVMEEVPFFIKMNMILVDSSELKRHMLRIIDEIQEKIEKSVYLLVMKRNSQIQSSLDNMILMASSPAMTCEKLVEIEDSVDSYRRQDIKNLQLKQQDLLKWISITLYNTFYPVDEEDLNKIYGTSQFLASIHSKLENEDIHIEDERKKLEAEVRRDSADLSNKVVILTKEL